MTNTRMTDIPNGLLAEAYDSVFYAERLLCCDYDSVANEYGEVCGYKLCGDLFEPGEILEGYEISIVAMPCDGEYFNTICISLDGTYEYFPVEDAYSLRRICLDIVCDMCDAGSAIGKAIGKIVGDSGLFYVYEIVDIIESFKAHYGTIFPDIVVRYWDEVQKRGGYIDIEYIAGIYLGEYPSEEEYARGTVINDDWSDDDWERYTEEVTQHVRVLNDVYSVHIFSE